MRNQVWLVLGVLSVIAAWLYVARILDPWEQYVDVEHGILKARMGDLYPRWVGTRALLFHGQNPYGREVSSEIQIGFYGHPIEQSYSGKKMIDEQRFAYPIYVVFLIAPIAYLGFFQAQMLTAVILAVLTAVTVLLWMNVLRWKPPKALVVAIVLFVLASPQVVQGLRLRQLGLVVGFLIALSVWCLARNHLTVAGMALALATIKPQMIVLPLAWFFFWGVSSWPARSRLLMGFGSALAGLVALGELILPGWPGFFVEGLVAYPKYAPMPWLLGVALGERLGIAVSVAMVFVTVVIGWRNRNVEAPSQPFNRTLTAFLICGSLVLPQVPQFNQILLLLPVLMFARDWEHYPAALRLLGTVLVPWIWLSYPGLLIFRPSVNSAVRYPLLPSVLTLFVPFFLLLVLAITPKVSIAAPS